MLLSLFPASADSPEGLRCIITGCQGPLPAAEHPLDLEYASGSPAEGGLETWCPKLSFMSVAWLYLMGGLLLVICIPCILSCVQKISSNNLNKIVALQVQTVLALGCMNPSHKKQRRRCCI